jgi:hypothetical protein
MAERFPDGTTHVVIPREQVETFSASLAGVLLPSVEAERRRYAPAA